MSDSSKTSNNEPLKTSINEKCAICGTEANKTYDIKYSRLRFCSEHQPLIDRDWYFFQRAFFFKEKTIFNMIQGYVYLYSMQIILLFGSFSVGLFSLVFIPQLTVNDIETLLVSVILLFFLYWAVSEVIADWEVTPKWIWAREDIETYQKQQENEKRFLLAQVIGIGGGSIGLLLGIRLKHDPWIILVIVIATSLTILLFWLYNLEKEGFIRLIFERLELPDNLYKDNMQFQYGDYQPSLVSSPLLTESLNFITRIKHRLLELTNFLLGFSFLILAIVSLWFDVLYLTALFELISIWFFYYDLNITEMLLGTKHREFQLILPLYFVLFFSMLRISLEMTYTVLGYTQVGDTSLLQILFLDSIPTAESSLVVLGLFLYVFPITFYLIPTVLSNQLVNLSLSTLDSELPEDFFTQSRNTLTITNSFLLVNLTLTVVLLIFPLFFGMITSIAFLGVLWLVQTFILDDDFFKNIIQYLNRPSIYIETIKWSPSIIYTALATYYWFPRILIFDIEFRRLDTFPYVLLEIVAWNFPMDEMAAIFGLFLFLIPILAFIILLYRRVDIKQLSSFQLLYLNVLLLVLFFIPELSPFVIFDINYRMIVILSLGTFVFYNFYVADWYLTIGLKTSHIERKFKGFKISDTLANPTTQSIYLMLGNFIPLYLIVMSDLFAPILGIEVDMYIFLLWVFTLGWIAVLESNRQTYEQAVQDTMQDYYCKCLACGKTIPMNDITCIEHTSLLKEALINSYQSKRNVKSKINRNSIRRR